MSTQTDMDALATSAMRSGLAEGSIAGFCGGTTESARVFAIEIAGEIVTVEIRRWNTREAARNHVLGIRR